MIGTAGRTSVKHYDPWDLRSTTFWTYRHPILAKFPHLGSRHSADRVDSAGRASANSASTCSYVISCRSSPGRTAHRKCLAPFTPPCLIPFSTGADGQDGMYSFALQPPSSHAACFGALCIFQLPHGAPHCSRHSISALCLRACPARKASRTARMDRLVWSHWDQQPT